MDQYRRLAELLNSLPAKKITLWQGIVKSVEGITCTVTFGKQDVPGVRLRASEADDGGHILIVPAAGTAVTVGSLSGDLSSLVVLKADRIESITVNGGNLGGLINIGALTEKINALVDAFNGHTHTIPSNEIATSGNASAQTNQTPVTVPAIQSKAQKFDRADYEDTTITH